MEGSEEDASGPPALTRRPTLKSIVSRAVDMEARIQDILKSPTHKVILMVPVESCHTRRMRHLVIVSAPVSKPDPAAFSLLTRNPSLKHFKRDDRQSSARIKMDRNSPSVELEYCLLGVDTWRQAGAVGGEESEVSTLGFVCEILVGTDISLDGDGGFGLHILQRHFVFKPVTLQCLWMAIQTLHAIMARLRPKRNYTMVPEQDWIGDYKSQISSPQSCINEWEALPDLLSRRPLSPDHFSQISPDAQDAETKKTVIKAKLRDIMKTVDLDDITSKSIRLSLEAEMEQKLEEFKPFIDEEILLILGQMDPASRIFDFMYLGSEWNASNLEELNSNGITHILNVTREIDNFFPAVFKYLNIREYDVEETDLLQYWGDTHDFILNCVQMGGRVLVHCKMGISRSASTVCAFAMKYFGWSLERALSHTKERRSIINPNSGFRDQLQMYEGILGASRQRFSFRKIQRSKSDSSVEASPGAAREGRERRGVARQASARSQRGARRRPASWSVVTRIDSESGSPLPSPRSSPPPPPPQVYHCYSTLAALLSPSSSSPAAPLPSTSSPSAVRTDVYTLPGLRKGEGEEEGEMTTTPTPTPTSSSCPAQFHINQCTCNFELELKVCDSPVDLKHLFEQTGETDLILKNLGNLPHIRTTQRRSASFCSSTRPPSTLQPAIPESAVEQSPHRDAEPAVTLKDSVERLRDDEEYCDRLDTSGAEELSVKTLADMFDFRLGEQPTKPPLPKTKDRLLIARMDQLGSNKMMDRLGSNKMAAQPLTDCSEC